MAMTVSVKTEDLASAANQVNADREKMARLLRGLIDSPVFGYWSGEASKVYRKKLQDLYGDITDVDNIFTEIMNDLRAMKKVYENTETTVVNYVNRLNPNSLTS